MTAVVLKIKSGHQCYRSTEDTTKIGDRAKCPKDPPPARNPDGSDAAIVDGFIDAYCQNAGRPAIPNFIGCLLYGYYEANGDPVAQIETGAVAVCDLILSGACTWFINVAPELADSMNRPCEEDPESLACEFPYPG
jgi:hypothetical protein